MLIVGCLLHTTPGQAAVVARRLIDRQEVRVQDTDGSKVTLLGTSELGDCYAESKCGGGVRWEGR